MRRVLPVFAAIISGGTLLVLVVMALGATRVELELGGVPDRLEAPEVVAMPVSAHDIAELHQCHGTVLAGSSLDGPDAEHGFQVAVARFTGETLPEPVWAPPSRREPVTAVREAAHEFEKLAHQCELVNDYEQADTLRLLASHARRVARSLRGDEAGKVSPECSEPHCP